MTSNHISLNLVTKGLLNISNITKGMITFVTIITPKKRSGGGSGGNYAYKGPYDVPIFKKIEEIDDISVIQVHIDWNKLPKNINKKLEVKLLKKQITAEILKETGKNINVEIV